MLIFIVSAMMIASCTRKNEFCDRTFFGMDTIVTIRLSRTGKDGRTLSEDDLDSVFRTCESLFAEIENACSRTIETGEVARLNHSRTGIDSENVHFLAVLTSALSFAEQTGGAYSPTVGILTELWDVNGEGHVPDDAELQKALRHIDYRSVTVAGTTVLKSDPDVIVDLGGIAKGYAAQIIVDYLRTTDVSYGLVSLGGNVGVFGQKPDGTPFRIGVTDPSDTASLIDEIDVTEGFVAVSGDYERYFVRDGVKYHHIFDPMTGCPAVSGIRSAAVWSTDGAAADALSTAFFVMGEDAARTFSASLDFPVRAVFTDENGVTSRLGTP